jgi:leucyl-tRNA synthetase
MYMMFMGDYEQGGDWSDEGIVGIHRFVNRLWRFFQDYRFADQKMQTGSLPHRVDYALNYTIQQVTEDIAELKFNTAISRMMELLSVLQESVEDGPFPGLTDVLATFARIVAPFAPHLGEELWHLVSGAEEKDSVFDQSWPEYNPKALVKETITLVVQINGKLRDRLEVPADIDKAGAVEAAKRSDKLAGYLNGKIIRKTIFVPGKLLNIVL